MDLVAEGHMQEGELLHFIWFGFEFTF